MECPQLGYWVSEREQDFIFLPVCSDKGVTKGTDEIAVSDSELVFRSTTDAAEIAKFLGRKGNKIIFSTFQSGPQRPNSPEAIALRAPPNRLA